MYGLSTLPYSVENSAAPPHSVRKAAPFRKANFKGRLRLAEAQPQTLSIVVGKAEHYRTECGEAAQASRKMRDESVN